MSPNDAGASKPIPDEPEPDEKTPTPSSSSCADEPAFTGTTTDDDVVVSLAHEGEDPEGPGEAVEAARECFGDDLAAVVEADAGRIGRKIGGRWDCFAAAVWMAAKVNPHGNPDTRIGYILGIALKDFIPGGVPAEAIAYRDEVRERRRKASEHAAKRERDAEAARREADRWAGLTAGGLIAAAEQLGWDVRLRPDGRFEVVDKLTRNAAEIPDAMKARFRECKQEVLAILGATRTGETAEREDD